MLNCYRVPTVLVSYAKIGKSNKVGPEHLSVVYALTSEAKKMILLVVIKDR